ncbi:DNA alkylation repair protein [Rhizobiaceae bacterium n13]|uniref:DNA alkylation repair protein n=1 Tax=Ferirhizobium litorale TaxID=2927786 RepID=A0AAE3QBG6_9HYPH|nr:DNA alkylation repair protein [Fererhizobium litorale]MDI7860770.1 DNA alkylation repair protein [Fererhizobium litorale]MDI7920918.1 DNA alkylation repair protein [Fererhizobium litorale]
MAEALKNLLHPELVANMATSIKSVDRRFDAERFFTVATRGLEQLELMQRSLQIRDALIETLASSFAEAAAVLADSLPEADRPGLTQWMLLPVNQFVAKRGLEDFELSLALLKKLTPHFTAEFGIRPFIHADQERALAIISEWVTEENHHVRRLASEGTRPRLPWAMRLPRLVEDPRPVLPILEALLDDPEDYVRRSVANSLNDIAKDHPLLVAEFVERHMPDASDNRRTLLRHASRTLFKKGHAKALANFGFGDAAGLVCGLDVTSDDVRFGAALAFSACIHNSATTPKQAMVDYAIHHRKADGSLSAKVFKWKSIALAPGETKELSKMHTFRPITTRRYYPGVHRLVVLVNGAELATSDFTLVMD